MTGTLDELEKLLAEWKQACARIDDPLQKDVIKLKALELALGIDSALPGLIESARRVERLEAANREMNRLLCLYAVQHGTVAET